METNKRYFRAGYETFVSLGLSKLIGMTPKFKDELKIFAGGLFNKQTLYAEFIKDALRFPI